MQKVGDSSRAPEVSEPEKQEMETAEAPIQDPEEPVNDPPPQIGVAIFEPMDTDNNPAAQQAPPSPKPPTPAKSTDKTMPLLILAT